MEWLQRYVPYLVPLGVLYLAWRLARAILGRRGRPSHTARARCSCGWRGTVSRIRPACPRCGARVQLPPGD